MDKLIPTNLVKKAWSVYGAGNDTIKCFICKNETLSKNNYRVVCEDARIHLNACRLTCHECYKHFNFTGLGLFQYRFKYGFINNFYDKFVSYNLPIIKRNGYVTNKEALELVTKYWHVSCKNPLNEMEPICGYCEQLQIATPHNDTTMNTHIMCDICCKIDKDTKLNKKDTDDTNNTNDTNDTDDTDDTDDNNDNNDMDNSHNATDATDMNANDDTNDTDDTDDTNDTDDDYNDDKYLSQKVVTKINTPTPIQSKTTPTHTSNKLCVTKINPNIARIYTHMDNSDIFMENVKRWKIIDDNLDANPHDNSNNNLNNPKNKYKESKETTTQSNNKSNLFAELGEKCIMSCDHNKQQNTSKTVVIDKETDDQVIIEDVPMYQEVSPDSKFTKIKR